jgi:hypothetical protein
MGRHQVDALAQLQEVQLRPHCMAGVGEDGDGLQLVVEEVELRL